LETSLVAGVIGTNGPLDESGACRTALAGAVAKTGRCQMKGCWSTQGLAGAQWRFYSLQVTEYCFKDGGGHKIWMVTECTVLSGQQTFGSGDGR
jgi:hypothetical protein